MVLLAAAIALCTEVDNVRAIYPARGAAFHVMGWRAYDPWVERRTLDGQVTRSFSVPPRTMITGADANGNLVTESYDAAKLVDGIFPPTGTRYFIPALTRGAWSVRIGEQLFLAHRDRTIGVYPGPNETVPVALRTDGTVVWILESQTESTITSLAPQDKNLLTRRLTLADTEAGIRDGFPFASCEFLNGRQIATFLRIETPKGTALSVPLLPSGGEPTNRYLSIIDRFTGRVTPLFRLPYQPSELMASLTPKTKSFVATRNDIVCVEGRTLVLLWEGHLWRIDASNRQARLLSSD